MGKTRVDVIASNPCEALIIIAKLKGLFNDEQDNKKSDVLPTVALV